VTIEPFLKAFVVKRPQPIPSLEIKLGAIATPDPTQGQFLEISAKELLVYNLSESQC
jgi:hypothetical protein